MQYNSDGYIMVDFAKVDFNRTNQTVPGLFERCEKVIGTNKFVLVINANGKTPLPSAVSITNGQYVIESVLFNFTISSNDNLNIKKQTPVSEIIDDDHTALNTTWSSNKINSSIMQTANSLMTLLPQKTHGILAAGATNLIIEDEFGGFFEDNKTYWVGTNKFGVMPTNVNVNVTEHYIGMTFEAQDTDTYVEVIKL